MDVSGSRGYRLETVLVWKWGMARSGITRIRETDSSLAVCSVHVFMMSSISAVVRRAVQ